MANVFDPPPTPDWISQTARTPLLPGFPSSRTPPPLDFQFFKRPLLETTHNRKRRNILSKRSLFIITLKARWLFQHFLKQIIRTIVVFLCKEHHLSVSVPQQMYKIRNSLSLEDYVDLRKITAKKVLGAIINKNYNSSFR